MIGWVFLSSHSVYVVHQILFPLGKVLSLEFKSFCFILWFLQESYLSWCRVCLSTSLGWGGDLVLLVLLDSFLGAGLFCSGSAPSWWTRLFSLYWSCTCDVQGMKWGWGAGIHRMLHRTQTAHSAKSHCLSLLWHCIWRTSSSGHWWPVLMGLS